MSCDEIMPLSVRRILLLRVDSSVSMQIRFFASSFLKKSCSFDQDRFALYITRALPLLLFLVVCTRGFTGVHCFLEGIQGFCESFCVGVNVTKT